MAGAPWLLIAPRTRSVDFLSAIRSIKTFHAENSLIFCMSHAVPHEEGPLEIVGPTASRLAEQIQYLALAQI